MQLAAEEDAIDPPKSMQLAAEVRAILHLLTGNEFFAPQTPSPKILNQLGTSLNG